MKKNEQRKELRELSEDDLRAKTDSLKEELMKLKFRHASGQLESSAQLMNLRRQVARAETILRERVSSTEAN